jgi:UDP-N-acetylglucosamine 4,6-dehydratase/5-epimerase
MENKKIFITGGAGFLGRNLIRRYYANNAITIYSRDEAKHYYLKKEFPRINCIIGDIRNLDLMRRSSKGHDIGIFAASIKQIEAVDQNVEEGVEIIINGALHSRRVAEENNMEAACFISSDKSRAATTLYGSMKFVAGESFIVNANHDEDGLHAFTNGTRLSCAVYGNVLNSTGSIIPLMWDAIRKNYELTLYSPEMTRFMIDIEEAIDLIEHGLELTGVNVVPNLKSFRLVDLFEIFNEEFGLTYKTGVPRIAEKLHEIMLSAEELPRTCFDAAKNMYILHYKKVFENYPGFPGGEFSSKDVVVSKNELKGILGKYNFFKPY